MDTSPPRNQIAYRGDLTDTHCAKCGVRTWALLWNRPLQRWFCHACFNGPRYERRTAYWAEEYDEPIGGRKPAAFPVDTIARMELYRKAGFTPGRAR